jgi:hypothetical protein
MSWEILEPIALTAAVGGLLVLIALRLKPGG